MVVQAAEAYMGTDLLIYFRKQWEKFASSMIKVNRMFNYLVRPFLSSLPFSSLILSSHLTEPPLGQAGGYIKQERGL